MVPLSVRILDSIRSILSKLAADAKAKIVYNNSVLSTAFSFAFYGIDDGSHIKVYPTPNEKEPKKSLVKRPPVFDRDGYRRMYEKVHGKNYDEEQFVNSYRSFVNPELAREAAKLRDLFFERVEGTIKSHRRLIKNFFGVKESDDEKDEQKKEKREKDDKDDKKDAE